MNLESQDIFQVNKCQISIMPCPHDTFPNWARSIATSSRPVARVHTGAIGTLVPDPRSIPPLDRERVGAIGRDRSRSVEFVVWTLDWALATYQQLSHC